MDGANQAQIRKLTTFGRDQHFQRVRNAEFCFAARDDRNDYQFTRRRLHECV